MYFKKDKNLNYHHIQKLSDKDHTKNKNKKEKYTSTLYLIFTQCLKNRRKISPENDHLNNHTLKRFLSFAKGTLK